MSVDFNILKILSEDAIERGNISKPYIVECWLDSFVDELGASSDEIFSASQRLATKKYVVYFPSDNTMGSIKLTQDGYDYYLSEKIRPKIGFN